MSRAFHCCCLIFWRSWRWWFKRLIFILIELSCFHSRWKSKHVIMMFPACYLGNDMSQGRLQLVDVWTMTTWYLEELEDRRLLVFMLEQHQSEPVSAENREGFSCQPLVRVSRRLETSSSVRCFHPQIYSEDVRSHPVLYNPYWLPVRLLIWERMFIAVSRSPPMRH